MSWYNPLVEFILQSPLHAMMSANTLLITYQGRKSGKTFTHPVDYEPHGDTILIFTKQSKAWWKNLQGDAPVTLLIKREKVNGVADIPVVTTDQKAAGLRAMYPFMSPAQAASIAAETVMIQVRRT